MAKIGLFYGSKRGNTQSAAERIKEEFDGIEPDMVTVFNVKKVALEKMNEFDKIILGSSTWEDGDLQMHWKRAFPQLDGIDLNGKQVAIFGFGDQAEFSTTFVSALATLAEKARERGAELVGYWPTEGYTFESSPAVENGHFVGLSLDNTNQYQLTNKRIKGWVEQLSREFGLSA
jgi:flavodoxin I